jgi:hypothetical protein
MADLKAKREIRIFYAWQSDLAAKFNRNAIKKSLRFVSGELEEQLSSKGQTTEVIIDEATRDSPGSPNIPISILQKIQRADIFVGDVSIINSNVVESRNTPNPNVVFELGFAVSNLGWERVILLVNEVHGKVELLPFDFDRHRAMTFKLTEGIGTPKELTTHLLGAISLILSKDPPRPRASHFDIAATQRERDLTNLHWLLGSIHWPTIEEHISNGPQRLSMPSTDFHDEVIYIVSSPLFHIYDDELKERIDKFVKHWSGSIKHDHYVPSQSGRTYVFRSGHPSQHHIEQKAWHYMQDERLKMHAAMNDLLAVIRAKFPEIDLRELSDATARRYDAEIADIKSRFERNPLLLKSRKNTRSVHKPVKRAKKPEKDV